MNEEGRFGMIGAVHQLFMMFLRAEIVYLSSVPNFVARNSESVKVANYSIIRNSAFIGGRVGGARTHLLVM